MTTKITEANNFCMVFMLPETYPKEFCFGGGHPVNFQLVDWFNPISTIELWSDGEAGSWEEQVPKLKDFLMKKNYTIPGRTYLALTCFGECFLFGEEIIVR